MKTLNLRVCRLKIILGKLASFFLSGLLVTSCSHSSRDLASENFSMSSDSTDKITMKTDESQGIQRVSAPLSGKQKAKTISNYEVQLPKVIPLELAGNLSISGSNTVFPLSKIIAERFIEEGFPGEVKVTSTVNNQGFKLFCHEGKLDIVNASRPISEAEKSACQNIGREPLGFQIAVDGITIVTSTQNKFLPTSINKSELIRLFTAESWSEVNLKWPNLEIKRQLPSGVALDIFAEVFFAGDRSRLINIPNTELWDIEDDLMEDILTNINVIGFLSFHYYKENQDLFKLLKIEGLEPGNKDYPLNRPLFIYVDAKALPDRPEVKAFVNYYLNNVNEEVSEKGYFPITSENLNQQKALFLQNQG